MSSDREALQQIANIANSQLSGQNASASAPKGDLNTNVRIYNIGRGESVKVPCTPGQGAAVAFSHGGGVCELKIEKVPGSGNYHSLSEQLFGPRSFGPQQVTPAGTTGQHTPIAGDMPPGSYTYYVQPDGDVTLGIHLVQ